MSSWKLRTCLSVSIAAALISACDSGGGGQDGPPVEERGVNGTFLFVTHQQQSLGEDEEQVLYYGTRNVGTTESFEVRIANRGADIHPLKNISVVAPEPATQFSDNSEEFAVQVLDNIVLQPSEVVTVDVSFTPITQGEKHARFVVDYETIKLVEESVNVNEQSFYRGNELAADGEFLAARSSYKSYLANDPVTINKRRAAIRLPIIDEAQSYGGDADLGLYLQAMTQRDEKDFAGAVRTLDVFAQSYPDSYLADDAQYLKGYIQLIDLDEPANALLSMQALRQAHPDTNYYDTSLYSDAIAQIAVGNAESARHLLQDLMLRHTGIDALGVKLPKDNLMSRMWFDRAAQMLSSV